MRPSQNDGLLPVGRLAILRERLICRACRTFGLRRTRNLGAVRLPYDLSGYPAYAYAWHDSYDIPLMVLMRCVLHEGGTFVDVGGNIGYTAAVGLNRVGRRGRVVAFEPVPQYHAMIGALGEANPGYRLQVEQAALSDRPGEAEIALSAANLGWNTMVPGFMREAHSLARVPVLVFDDYVRSNRIERIDLIKIDVEGYELPVLDGMRATLARLRPPIHLECAPQAYALLGRSVADLNAFLVAVGYRARDAQSLRPVDPAGLRCTANLLLTPDR